MVAGTAANPLRPEELELDACASFLVRHGLHLTALELAQEMQDLHGEDALCATLRTFLEDLPSHVLAGAAMVKTTGYGKDTDPLGTLPLGAAERSSRPWDERTLLLEYEMRLCKEDFAQAEERCEALQKELDKVCAVAAKASGKFGCLFAATAHTNGCNRREGIGCARGWPAA